LASSDAIRHDATAGAAQRLVDAETAFANGDGPPRSFRVWRNLRSIVAPAREAGNPLFRDAAMRSSARSWPVAIRSTGGLAVPHGSEVVCLSLRWLDLSPPGAQSAYEILAKTIQAAAAGMGQSSNVGEVPGAICPGAWDLAVGGRKVAGLAQRRMAPRRDGRTAVLAHAMVFCGLELDRAIMAINAYYADLTIPRAFDPAAHTNLCPSGEVVRVMDAIAATARSLGFEPTAPKPHREQARLARSC
jgi:octanoyl-[GcvH]:protein N-octanoyltransferase